MPAGLVCAVLLIPAGSAAASTTVGSPLADNGAGASLSNCDPLCTFIPTDVLVVGGPGPVTSPIDGVVVRWGTSAADPSDVTSTVRLRVIESPAPNQWVGVGTGPVEHTVVPFQNVFFAVSPGMPISAGDYIGVDTVRDNGSMEGSTVRGAPGRSLVDFHTTLPDGGSPQAAASESSFEAYVQATVEPDADQDLFGDETQDQCPGSAGPQNGCPPPANPPPPNTPPDAHKKKCKKHKKKHGKRASESKKQKKHCKKKHKNGKKRR